jgi:cobalt-zinc-cadmium efflux system protein
VLNLALVASLIVVGLIAHSLAVFAEGSDYLLDAAGVGVALLAIRLEARPTSRARPNGYPKATSVAALVNAGWLLILELLVAGAAAALGVAAAGGIILATRGWYWLDPAVALAVAVVVAYHAFRLVRKVLGRLRPAAADSAA